MSDNWLSTDPKTWKIIIAGSPQSCPDDCGLKIVPADTKITNVAGAWRRLDCVLKQWQQYHNDVIMGTESDLIAAVKRMNGYIVVRSWDSKRPRGQRFYWTEHKEE